VARILCQTYDKVLDLHQPYVRTHGHCADEEGIEAYLSENNNNYINTGDNNRKIKIFYTNA